jgi:glycosyltransferase involved in cell wall biosynthesis
MISVIVCSRQPPSWDTHQRNVCKTIGAQHEYVRVDNSQNSYGTSAAYNQGIQKAQGDIFVFVHEDVFFMECGWGAVVESKFRDESLGLLGVAGSQYLPSSPPKWFAPGMPFTRGRVVHELDNGTKYFMTMYSRDKGDAEVVVADGLFLAIKADLFENLRFDGKTFDGFHFYDLDICMQVRKTHRLVVTWDIMVKHLSGGQYDESWERYAKRFTNKYPTDLPATCTEQVPDFSSPVPFGSYDLKGKAPQVTII